MAEHTPGPWSLTQGPSITVKGADECDVAFIVRWQRNGGVDIANGHLIEAAPDLLAALKALLDPDKEGDVEIAVAAIRKAEGKP